MSMLILLSTNSMEFLRMCFSLSWSMIFMDRLGALSLLLVDVATEDIKHMEGSTLSILQHSASWSLTVLDAQEAKSLIISCCSTYVDIPCYVHELQLPLHSHMHSGKKIKRTTHHHHT